MLIVLQVLDCSLPADFKFSQYLEVRTLGCQAPVNHLEMVSEASLVNKIGRNGFSTRPCKDLGVSGRATEVSIQLCLSILACVSFW